MGAKMKINKVRIRLLVGLLMSFSALVLWAPPPVDPPSHNGYTAFMSSSGGKVTTPTSWIFTIKKIELRNANDHSYLTIVDTEVEFDLAALSIDATATSAITPTVTLDPSASYDIIRVTMLPQVTVTASSFDGTHYMGTSGLTGGTVDLTNLSGGSPFIAIHNAMRGMPTLFYGQISNSSLTPTAQTLHFPMPTNVDDGARLTHESSQGGNCSMSIVTIDSTLYPSLSFTLDPPITVDTLQSLTLKADVTSCVEFAPIGGQALIFPHFPIMHAVQTEM